MFFKRIEQYEDVWLIFRATIYHFTVGNYKLVIHLAFNMVMTFPAIVHWQTMPLYLYYVSTRAAFTLAHLKPPSGESQSYMV
jgi:hypothetical protein